MMVEGEATQEPTAPEGALASPPAEATAESAPETASAAEAQGEPEVLVEAAAPLEAEASAEAAPAAPSLDWSHLRGFQTVEAPAEALAALPDYAEELKKELAARAAQFARSVDESIVLSSDGLMRWLGDPVARVVAGEELLQPRAVLLADEALTGEDRATVETRAALWISAHIRKALGPLLALAGGADLPEAAKALGGKIAEALGVLDRDRVRNDVRALDQTARGALRKLGVRFGSLYIYVPVLLKPGARGLCSLLWTLRRGSEPGADRLLAFAAAGRTSFANEGLLSPDAYRVAGFRLCGERVVRVDITERLSDLIRAAIPDHMRSGSRPASEAYGFLVTPQMTSLTGCSGEAFASILRSLGFELVKVSKAAFEAANAKAPTEPIKPVSAPADQTTPEVEAAPEGEPSDAVEAAQEAEIEAGAAEVEPAQETEPTQETEPANEAEAALEADPIQEAEAAPASDVAATAESVEISDVAEASGAQAEAEAEVEAPAAELASEPSVVEEEGAVATEAAAAEPAGVASAPGADEEIEVWRPAPRRPRAPRHQHGAERDNRPHRGKPHRHDARPAAAPTGEAAATEARAQTPQRLARPERRDEKPKRFDGKGEGRDDRRPQKDFGSRRESRPVQVDPDSPFAKLAALKPLLERRDKRP